MGQPKIEDRKYTIEEWKVLEQSDETRYEYHFGEVFAMAGGTIDHTRISKNALFELEVAFEEDSRKCEAFTADLKIEIDKNDRYVYPDTLAVCGEIEESDTVKGAITNPVIVIEVMSDSSEAYDRGVKYKYYKKLITLKEYLLVDQHKPSVTLYRRHGNGDMFLRLEIEGIDAMIELESLGITLSMKRLYRNVVFGDQAIKN